MVTKSEVSTVNIWIGNDQAVSSLHKDPYENFYIVGNTYFKVTN
jgi:hypothetical protein